MEFRFRGKDNRPPPVFSDQASHVEYTGSESLLPEGRTIEELERELQEEKIRGEIIARRIMRRRMLEEEQQQNTELKHKKPGSWTEDHQSSLFVSNMSAYVAQRMSSPVIEEIKEVQPEVNTPIKTPFYDKRRYSASFAQTLEVEPPKIIKEWGCALCHASAASEDEFNDHLKGKEHLANVSKLGSGGKKAIENGNCDKTLNGKTGNVNVQEKEGKAARTEEGMENKDVDEGELNCTICHISATGKFQLTEHMKGKKHLANVRKFNASNNSVTKTSNGNDSSLNGNSAPEKNNGNDASSNGKAINTPERQVVVKKSRKGEVHDAIKENNNDSRPRKVARASHLKENNRLVMAQLIPTPDIEEGEIPPNEIELPEQNAAYEKTNTSPPSAQTGVDLLKSTKVDLNCTLCNIRVTGKRGLGDHLKGKRHMSNVIKHSSISEKEMKKCSSGNSSSNDKGTNTAESKENVESGEI